MKTALIALTLLLLGSLATSAYLLMEQKKAEKLINNAHVAAEDQKKKGLKLTEQKIAEEKEKLDFKSKLDGATKKLSEAEVNLEIARGELGQATKNIKSAHEANASLQVQSTSIAAELQNQKDQLSKTRTDYNVANAKLSKELIDANKTNTEKSVELDKAVEALKPFLATGLTPEQIKELQHKKPIEIAAPRFIAPKPIQPGKLNKPILKTEQTP